MLDVLHLSKTFRSGRGSVSALKDISFHLNAGESVMLIGKSGSGKTTLLNCLGGLEKPDTGRVMCGGVDINALTAHELSLFHRSRVGFVFQSSNLISYLTVKENISIPLELNGISGLTRDRRVLELLSEIGLSGVGGAFPRELSGGETQRVAFARAIAHGPALLLADEPTASLDSATAGQLIQWIRDLSLKQGCTLVVATHDPEIMDIADHQLVLKDGWCEAFQ